MALTDSQIRSALSADSRYRLSDGEHGLYLCVHPHGGKYFVFRFTWRGKDAELALGTYPKKTLKKARIEAADAEQKVEDGIAGDPLRWTDPLGLACPAGFDPNTGRLSPEAQAALDTWNNALEDLATDVENGDFSKAAFDQQMATWAAANYNYAIGQGPFPGVPPIAAPPAPLPAPPIAPVPIQPIN